MTDSAHEYRIPAHLRPLIDEAALQEFVKLLPANGRVPFLQAFQQMLETSGATDGRGKEFGFSADLTGVSDTLKEAFNRIFRRLTPET